MLASASGFNDLRTFGKVSPPGQSAAAIVSVVTLSTSLVCLAQIAPQASAGRLVTPDILVNRLVADSPSHQPEAADMADDLLWPKILAK
jgi:hypothetical protein